MKPLDLAFTAPMVWILYELHSPELTLAGAATVFSPGIILGRNDHIAWGFTNVGTDIQDLYVIDQKNSTHYVIYIFIGCFLF